MSKVTITGIKEIAKVFKEMPNVLTHKIMQEAHAAAAKPLVQAEKLAAPEGPTGRLIDSIGIIKSPIGNVNNMGEITVGPRRGRRLGGNLAHLVEYGTIKRSLKGNGLYRAGTNRGVMPAKKFAEPSFLRTRDIVLNSINDQYGRKLTAFLNRTVKK